MKLIEIHIEGGIEFMSVLLILLIVTIWMGVMAILKRKEPVEKERWIRRCIDISLFALVWGILGQAIGLFSAFQAIEEMGSVPQDILAGGLAVSSYTTMYGLIIFLIGRLFKIFVNFSE
ncbi:MotA/TolQ/ExbB proton channel family protein [Marivirga sp. S37H4]|uniref:MotA/TolQ/ExbB proton channel family protein n=1 Tax=Marivirga aurantiaca TaxID=2802615 RepID=A0A935CC05_9BACT|nr:MotA/TolQ/ExbB proton channel family protein [Marivirga aurantiaca]MBK6267117.1 MotA/TolQ/ExbB proton channel family protein [Marivirga aurantiaca]